MGPGPCGSLQHSCVPVSYESSTCSSHRSWDSAITRGSLRLFRYTFTINRSVIILGCYGRSLYIVSIVPAGNSEVTGEWSVCARCETYRPPRAHHCRVCRRCVRRMDHHCPWINNCVGERNQRHFVLFLFYVAVLSVYAAAMVLVSWLVNCPTCDQETVQYKQTKV